MVRQLDFERGFFILQNGVNHLRAHGAWEEVWAAFELKHGDMSGCVMPTIEEIIRRDAITAMRGYVEDVDHRFFLALLLNVPDRSSLLDMVARRYPGEAIETILRWGEEMMEIGDSGPRILDAEFPMGVKVPEEDQPEVFLKALRFLLDGGASAGDLPVGCEDCFRGALMQSSWRVLIAGE